MLFYLSMTLGMKAQRLAQALNMFFVPMLCTGLPQPPNLDTKLAL